MRTIKQDLDLLKAFYQNMPTHWDGKKCILELKDANFQWRQMEWIAFYFEFISRRLLNNNFGFPGETFGRVVFDLIGATNWDTKAIAITEKRCILNDKIAMDKSIEKHGSHGEIIARCAVEKDDPAIRSFQNWHTKLKGGKSDYEKEREQRTSVSRLRKTKAVVTEILLLIVREEDVEHLLIHRQGRNSNGAPRNVKYMIDLRNIGGIECHKISFGQI